MVQDIREKYINLYTDFGFKKMFGQAEIAKYSEAERRQYEASQKEYWDYTGNYIQLVLLLFNQLIINI